uniref:BRCT domain-containing protein n=1 Tax=Panagrolaimus sp. PS1159 TaxID=55785 RepID=A0AC35FSL4_9BILA
MAADNLSDLGSSISTTQADTRRIYCVVLKDLENLSELQERQLNKAHELLKQHNAKVGVTSAKNVMKITTKLAGLSYIIPEFDGELYEHLVKHNARIYGPLAIIQSINKTEKYQRAVKDRIMIVSPAWVDFVYEAAKHGTLSNNIPLGDYMIKVFTGCFMTTSGFNGDQRLKISQLVRQHGGEFSGSMAQQTCTHLVIDSNTGEKYRKAVEWKTVKIVTLKWLMKCAESGVRYDEDKYQPGVKTSTQAVHNKTLSAPDVSEIFSKTRNPAPPPSSTASSNASIVAGDHTMMNNRQRNATATAIIGTGVTPLKMPFLTSTPRNQSFVRMESSQLSAKVADPVMDFDITLYEEGFGDYLEDCRLHFYEVTDDQKRVYRRLANCTGCSIADSIDSATHIIVPPGNYSTTQMKLLKEAVESDREVVQCQWLIACVQRQENLNTEAYIYPGLRENDAILSGQGKPRGSSLAQEFHVSQEVLDAINPECDLSSMHNTRSFEKRLKDVNIENKDGEEEEEDDRDFQHNETILNNEDEEMTEEDDLDRTIIDGNVPQQSVFEHEESDKDEEMNDKGNDSEFDAFGKVTEAEKDDEDENEWNVSTPKASGYKKDGLDLSMPLNEYLSGERPVKLHYPFDQLRAAISDESEPDSPTVDVLKLKAALAVMAKNSCQTDSEYNEMIGKQVMDDRDWRDLSLYRQPVNHDFRSPLKRPLPYLQKLQQIPNENFDDAAVAAAVVEDEEVNVGNGGNNATANEVEHLNDEETDDKENEGDAAVAESSKDNVEIPKEDTVHLASVPLKKPKSADPILQPDLLKRCEAIASHSTTAAENVDDEKLSQTRKSAPTNAVERLADFNDQLSFSSDKNEPQQNASPAKVTWEEHYSTQQLAKLEAKSKNHNFIPSTQMLVQDDNFFDADSADPFQRLSNQNLFGKIKAKDLQEKNILQSKNGNNEKSSAEEEATVSQDNEDKSGKENVEPMAIDEPVFEDDQQVVVAENEKSNQVVPVKEAPAGEASSSNQDMDDDDSFNKTWPDIPVAQSQQQKITQVKPQRRRIFGLEEESEEGTDDSELYRSAAILAGVRPKPKRQVPAPEPEANSNDSIQIAEEVLPPPPQPANTNENGDFVVPQISNIPIKSRRSSVAKKSDCEISRNVIEISQSIRTSQRLKRKAEEAAAKSPHPTEPGPKHGKRGSSSSSATTKQPPESKKNDGNTPELEPSNFHQVIFTNFDPQEKERLQEQVRAIQGTNLNQTIEMPTADLVICNKLQRSEKLMAALAAGKYIVPSTYIIESNRKGYWLPREDFEYGNPKSARKRISFSNVKDSAVAQQILNACFRLRYKAESVGHGAFHGWKAIIFAQAEVGASLIRIIECGGGEAKLFTNVAHKEYKNFTMAIISSKSNPGSFTNVESSILNQNKIPYYTDQVLSTYLLSTDTDNALKKSWHLQYRDFMKQQSKK